MSSTALGSERTARGRGHVPPAWSTVLRQQVWLSGRKQRRALALVTLLAAVAALLRLVDGLPADRAVDATRILLPSIYPLGLLLALLWPALAWSDEGPGDRSYHWSLPVSRPSHDLIRTAVGGAWFMAAVTVGLTVGFAGVALVWGRPTVPGAFAPLAAAAMAMGLAYLGGSIPALLSEHPYRWLLGVFLALLGLGLLGSLAAMRWPWAVPVFEAGTAVFEGTYGLDAALEAPEVIAGSDGDPAARAWTALLLWLGLAAGGVVGAALRYQQRAKGAAE